MKIKANKIKAKGKEKAKIAHKVAEQLDSKNKEV